MFYTIVLLNDLDSVAIAAYPKPRSGLASYLIKVHRSNLRNVFMECTFQTRLSLEKFVRGRDRKRKVSRGTLGTEAGGPSDRQILWRRKVRLFVLASQTVLATVTFLLAGPMK